MIEENGRGRLFLGVHWLFDAFIEDQAGRIDVVSDIGGVPLGLNIAEDIVAHVRAAVVDTSPQRNWKSTVGSRQKFPRDRIGLYHHAHLCCKLICTRTDGRCAASSRTGESWHAAEHRRFYSPGANCSELSSTLVG